MKTERKNRKFNNGFGVKSRKRKDRIINVMVLSIICFIAVLLISEIA